MWPYVTTFQQRNNTQYEVQAIEAQLRNWLVAGVIAEVMDKSQVHVQPIHVIAKGDPQKPRGM